MHAAAISSGPTTTGHVTVIDDATAATTILPARHRAKPQVHERAVLVGIAERGRREHERGDGRQQREAEGVDEAGAGQLVVAPDPTRRSSSP